jgi:streptogramin lyase
MRSLSVLTVAAVAAIAATSALGVSGSDTITTFAGTSQGFSGDGGPATAAKLNQPYDVAVDRNGNVYIADTGNNRIRKVAPNGTITTWAGNGVFYPFSGDGGPATGAHLYVPEGVAVDARGNVYIADRNNGVVRRIAPDGIITTFAGTRNAHIGRLGDGGPATSAELLAPDGVAVDAKGDVFIADRDHNRIRKVDSSGTITTIAGTGLPGNTGTGGPATSAEIFAPYRVAVDGKGNVYFTEVNNNLVWKINTAGTLSTFAGDPALGASSFLTGLAVDGRPQRGDDDPDRREHSRAVLPLWRRRSSCVRPSETALRAGRRRPGKPLHR